MLARDARCGRIVLIAAAAGLLLAGCIESDCTSAPGAALWGIYADPHGLGSNAQVEEFFGDLEAKVTKAPDPSAADGRHPYAGFIVFVAPDQSAVDMRNFRRLVIEYQLTGPMHVLLEQEGIPKGEDFGAPLPESSSARQISLPLDHSTFRQPLWVRSPASLADHRLVGVKFQVLAEHGATARIELRSVQFEGGRGCIRKRAW